MTCQELKGSLNTLVLKISHPLPLFLFLDWSDNLADKPFSSMGCNTNKCVSLCSNQQMRRCGAGQGLIQPQRGRLSAALEQMDWLGISSFRSDGWNCCMPHQRLKDRGEWLCICVLVRVRACLPGLWRITHILCTFLLAHVKTNLLIYVCKWYHLVLHKQYEPRSILNAPIVSYVTAESEPNASVNNAYWCTIRYLHTILPLKNFSVFSYTGSILLLSHKSFKEYSLESQYWFFEFDILHSLHFFQQVMCTLCENATFYF